LRVAGRTHCEAATLWQMHDAEFFIGREDQQERFRAALGDIAASRRGGPSEALVFLLYGHGGVGKSSLLHRFAAIASGDAPGVENTARFTVATVDWELEQRRSPAEFSGITGPPIWRVLDRVYRAMVEAKVSPSARRHVERAFSTFRRQMVREPELMERARALGLDGAVARGPLSDEERAQLAEAITQLAGAGLSVKLGTAGKPAASMGRVAVTAAVRGLADRMGRLEPEAYASLTSEAAALVRAFGKGLETVGRKCGPVVVLLDSCELLGEILNWLPELASRSGARVAWVIAMRQDVDAAAPREGVAGQLAAQLHQERVVLLPLTPFGSGELADYMNYAFGNELPEGVTAERMARTTRGVPLAVSLVTSFLRQGDPADEVFGDAAVDGSGREVVVTLMRRYLARLHASADSAVDLPLVYGLALLSEMVDVQVLAALWAVHEADVPGVLDRLRDRYDFVLGGSRPLHRDVTSATLAYLRGRVERASVRSMNERAVAVLRARLPKRPLVVETRVTDEDWQRDLLALLWHTFWVDVHSGHGLLCHIFAPAAVLDAALALELTQLASYFESLYGSGDRDVLRELSLLASRPFSAQEYTERLAAVEPALAEYADEGVFTDEERRRFAEMLSVMHGDLFGLPPARRLDLADSLLDRVPKDGSAAHRDVVTLHRRLTGWLACQVPGDCELALRAARRGVEISPGEAVMHAVFGSVLLQAGRPVDAEAALREAQRLEYKPHRATMLGLALQMQGRHAESFDLIRAAVAELPEEDSAEARQTLADALIEEGFRTGNQAVIQEIVDTLRVAARVRPNDPAVLRKLTIALMLNREFGPAEITVRHSLTIERLPISLAHLGLVLSQLGQLPEAVDAFREAIELEPGSVVAHIGLGATLDELGDNAGSELESREVIKLDPDYAIAHENLAASLFKQGRHAEAAESQRRSEEARARRSDADGVEFFLHHPSLRSGEIADWMQAKTAVDRINHLIALNADEEAIRELTGLLERDPAAGQLKPLLGSLLTKQQRYRDAEPVLRAAIASDPADAAAHASLALCVHWLGHRAEAVETARAAARLGTDDATVLAAAVAVLGEEGQHEEAIAHGLAAIRLLPEEVNIKVNVALSLRIRGRFQEAERLLRDAVAVDERDADAYADLGEIQLFLGKHAAALRSLQHAADFSHPGQTAKVQTLLGALLWAREPARARKHFQLALTATRRPGSAFAHIELQTLAATALGMPDAAPVLNAARQHRLPTDTFRRPIYDLLAQTPTPGLDAMTNLWREIIAEDPSAAGPFTC
jgi:tetratricopeptide (TPR) repeat protein